MRQVTEIPWKNTKTNPSYTYVIFFLVLRTLHVCYPRERINHFHKSQNAAAACAQCSIQNTNVHVSVLDGEFWDMKQVCSEICELGQLYELNTSPFPPKVKKKSWLENCWQIVTGDHFA